MHEKTWVLEGTVASLIALVITYYVLEPSVTLSRFGGPIGWSAAVVISVLVIQSFWKMLPHRGALRDSKPDAGYEFALNRWGGLHVALSIVVLILVLVHGIAFLPTVFEPSLLIWLGVASFLILIVLNLSGVVTESKRRTRGFGRQKILHLLLMVFALVLGLAHIEGLMSGLFPRSIIAGGIVGLVGSVAVFIIVPLTVRMSH
jgi:hypothetical protein